LLSSEQAAVYLIPNTLGECTIEYSLPPDVAGIVSSLHYFLVEDEKAGRKLIKALVPAADLRQLSIHRIPESPTSANLDELMAPLASGHSIGIISDAGCPGIADPGAEIVTRAHQQGFRVAPLVGPCSMVLALMASGLNGQAWRFVGYLPIEATERATAIRNLDERARTTGETQIIMDTPYRNEKLLQELLERCHPTTKLCIAQGLTTAGEYIRTKSVSEWRKEAPKLAKLPCLFLLGGR
jgi:16S rRNA (cytidine1402-2'-O)-methyltransferase